MLWRPQPQNRCVMIHRLACAGFSIARIISTAGGSQHGAWIQMMMMERPRMSLVHCQISPSRNGACGTQDRVFQQDSNRARSSLLCRRHNTETVKQTKGGRTNPPPMTREAPPCCVSLWIGAPYPMQSLVRWHRKKEGATLILCVAVSVCSSTAMKIRHTFFGTWKAKTFFNYDDPSARKGGVNPKDPRVLSTMRSVLLPLRITNAKRTAVAVRQRSIA